MSGVFTYAKRIGVLDGVNPMQGVSIPKGREVRETYAYSLDEVIRMLTVLPEPAATIVATAAFTGVRHGEFRSLRWENYDGKSIRVMQSVWNSHINEPKTRSSKAPVPVIAPLAKLLDAHRKTSSNPNGGWIFSSVKGTPLNLNNLARRTISPVLNSAGLHWHGWHAFRRGLATKLHSLGVRDKDLQGIVRHSDLTTTMNIYVKALSEDASAAMRLLEATVQLMCSQQRDVSVPAVN